jgi:hypothetical protein
MGPVARSCIPRQHLINRLRELGFTFRKRTGRVELYRCAATARRVEIVRKDLLDEEAVRSILRQSGVEREEIERFIGETRTSGRRAR